MRRRAFLATLGAGAIVGPAWLRRAFGDTAVPTGNGAAPTGASDPETAPGHAFAGAARAAKQAGQGLLVLVIPENEDQRPERGSLLGAYLLHASASQMAPLARTRVVAATLEELRRGGVGVSGEPLLVAIAPGGAVRATSADGAPPQVYDNDQAEERSIDRRIAWVAARVREVQGTDGDPHEGMLVATRLRQGRVDGSYWATSHFCGQPTVDGLRDEKPISMDCGMGMASERSRRFLYFFAQSPSARYRARYERKQ